MYVLKVFKFVAIYIDKQSLKQNMSIELLLKCYYQSINTRLMILM